MKLTLGEAGPKGRSLGLSHPCVTKVVRGGGNDGKFYVLSLGSRGLGLDAAAAHAGYEPVITRAQAATRIGYAGLSKAGSGGLAGAVAMLRAAGCARIFEERSPGGRWNRPALDGALRALQPGDTLVAPSLDHLSRSMNDLLLILSRVEAAGPASARSTRRSTPPAAPAG